MKKIVSLFQRNYDGDRLVRNEVTPGAEWVLAGEGYPTRKMDGTCCMIRDGKLFKRYEMKQGAPIPPDFEAAGDVDETTGKLQGWRPVGDGPDDRWHREGLETTQGFPIIDTYPEIHPTADGTYELVGPKIQGNPERYEYHCLVLHGAIHLRNANPRDFESIKEYLRTAKIEGIVWHHKDGRMVKIKTKDFGLTRGN